MYIFSDVIAFIVSRLISGHFEESIH